MKESFKKKEIYETEMTKECAKKILNVINDNRFLIKVKFIQDKSIIKKKIKYVF